MAVQISSAVSTGKNWQTYLVIGIGHSWHLLGKVTFRYCYSDIYDCLG